MKPPHFNVALRWAFPFPLAEGKTEALRTEAGLGFKPRSSDFWSLDLSHLPGLRKQKKDLASTGDGNVLKVLFLSPILEGN